MEEAVIEAVELAEEDEIEVVDGETIVEVPDAIAAEAVAEAQGSDDAVVVVDEGAVIQLDVDEGASER